MDISSHSNLATASATLLLAPSLQANEIAPIRIVLIGDSTVCNYEATRSARGWGQFIEEKFTEGSVEVINLAVAGRSTKTFISEGLWHEALNENPDFILIQFGHNASHAPENPESTDANTTYKEFLRHYVEDSRKIGATPILVTPMVRRDFDAQDKLIDTLSPYANAMKEVGEEKTVAVIDLHTLSAALIERLGPQASSEMANAADDKTHFNERGARMMADLVMNELPAMEMKLKEVLKSTK